MNTPEIGLGTYRLLGDEAELSVRMALDMGYRHVDTAQIYDNEQAIGHVLSKISLLREEIFVTTKIWIDVLSKKDLLASLHKSLEKLRTNYVDLTLIHWPSPRNKVPLEETLGALMEAKQQGLTKEIGLSNFTISQIQEAVEIVGAKNIATNQIEVHPFLQNRRAVESCQDYGIKVTAYMPLAYGRVMTDPVLQSIAEKHAVTPADVALSWLLDQDMVVIPSSTKEKHLLTNLRTPRGFLDDSDRKAIAALDCNGRIANPEFAPAWDL